MLDLRHSRLNLAIFCYKIAPAMIKYKTVFILGAGASMPYGFPSGQLLKDYICENSRKGRGNGGFLEDIEESGFSRNDIIMFSSALRGSPLSSVDAFLENQQKFLDVGKACIAAVLLKNENERNLFDYWTEKRLKKWSIGPNLKVYPDEGRTKSHVLMLLPGDNLEDGSWYQELFLRLNAPLKDFIKNEVIYVTFNYDRSLEHYLYTSLKNTYHASDEDCRRIFKKNPVIHLYGHLGLLTWQVDSKEKTSETVEYKPNVTPERIKIAAKNINIIRKGETDLSQFNLAFEHLEQAKKIHVLGFGYDKENMMRLKLHILNNTKELYGTTYGLGEQEMNLLRHMPVFSAARTWDRLYNKTAYRIMRENLILE